MIGKIRFPLARPVGMINEKGESGQCSVLVAKEVVAETFGTTEQS